MVPRNTLLVLQDGQSTRLHRVRVFAPCDIQAPRRNYQGNRPVLPACPGGLPGGRDPGSPFSIYLGSYQAGRQRAVDGNL